MEPASTSNGPHVEALASRPAGALQRLQAIHDPALAGPGLAALLGELDRRLRSGEAKLVGGNDVALADLVAEQLAALADIHDNRFSRQRHFDLFHAFHGRIAPPRPELRGATFLDLGCGSATPLGYSFLMRAMGAERCIAVDLDPVQDPIRAQRALVRLHDYLLADPTRILGSLAISRAQIEANLSSMDIPALRAGTIAALPKGLEYHNTTATSLPIATASVDLAISNSFLEHVMDLDSVLAELARVVRPGGFAIHGIDGVDHRHYADRRYGMLEFLKEPGRHPVGNGNRLRPLEYPALLARHGFTVQEIKPLRSIPLTEDEIGQFAIPWRDLPAEWLRVACATLVCRRT